MADLLEDVRTQIRARMEELRPAVDELARLEHALSALEDGPQSAPRVAAARSAKSARAPAEREALRARALGLIGERPGITKAELREAVGLSRQEAGQMVRRLLAAEAIEALALPSGRDGYRTPTPSDTHEQDDSPPATPGDAEPSGEANDAAT